MKNKKFDCVDMMRNIRNQIHEEWKDKSGKEFIEFLQKKYPNFSRKKTTSKT